MKIAPENDEKDTKKDQSSENKDDADKKKGSS